MISAITLPFALPAFALPGLALPGLMAICTASTAFASFFLKRSSGSVSAKALVTNKHLYLGILLYTVAAAINVLALRDADYSAVLPFASVSYIWTILLAKHLLGETVSIRKWIGAGFIIAGVAVISLH